MRYASAEVVPYALPFHQPYVTARGRLDRREMVLFRLRDEDGVVGLGEAVPLSMRGGATLARVVEELEGLAELGALEEEAVRGAPLSAPSRCAALTALLDLRGRRADADAPESSEHDTATPPPVRCNATLVAGPAAVVAADAERWAGEGFSAFKLKLGAGQDDVGQVRAVRDAVGDEARIRVDANGACDVETARRRLAELEPFDIELAEQPVQTMDELRAVAGSTSIPIAGDESIASREDAERAARIGACSIAGVKLSKVGGPEAAIEIAEALPCYLSSALDGPVGIAAAAAVSETLREAGRERIAGDRAGELAEGLATQRLFSATIASVESELRGGCLYPPSGPGLGVEIDEAALEAHRL
jgi:L-Ala-D/L-Glu epimerase / N-acetyl-D-glutamate racemase